MSSDKNQHIQCRLHEDVEYEGDAIAYYRRQLAEGKSPRQIICDALLRAADFEPSMFPQDKGRVTVDKIENLLASFAHEIIQSIGNRTFHNPDSDSQESSEIDDIEYAQNIAKAYLNRRNRGS